MKKFFRNLFSGYFLVLLILLIEIAVIIYIQFFLESTIEAILGQDDTDNERYRS